MGRHFTSRMVYDKALAEYLLYVSENPTRLEFVSGRIVGFPDSPEVTNMIIKTLKKSNLKEARIILADLYFKLKEFRKVLNISKADITSQLDLTKLI